ncbi:MAG: SH3 domain-containing protein [Gammaproteobacteria bacterium]|nr:SH3 domain-containing protein [Gammaproteobacteria bacterium]
MEERVAISERRITACAAWLAVHLAGSRIWFPALREAVIGLEKMAGEPVPERAVATTEELNCRTGPDLQAGIITVWSAGDRLSVWGSSDDDDGREWLMVSGRDGMGGWVSASYVTDNESPAPVRA